MASQKNRAGKGNGPKNGPRDGKGETKSIAYREQLKTGKSKNARGRGQHQVDTSIPVLTRDEFISCKGIGGHHVFLPSDDGTGATFEVSNLGDKLGALTLVNSTSKVLAPFVNVDQNVFLTYRQIVADEFQSPLVGKWQQKRLAMREFIRSSIGESGITTFAEIIKNRHHLQPEEEMVVVDTLAHVGENLNMWNQGNPDIAKAFAAMSDVTPAKIRISGTPNEGVMLGFFYNYGAWGMKVFVGHVGKMSKLRRVVHPDAFLFCYRGMLPDSIPDSVKKHELGASAAEMLQFMMGLDYAIRAQIMDGMYNAYRRIVQTKMPIQLVKMVARATPVQMTSPVPVLAPAPAIEEAVSEHPVQMGDQFDIFVESLRNAGLDGDDLARATAAYLKAQARPQQLRAPQFGTNKRPDYR